MGPTGGSLSSVLLPAAEPTPLEPPLLVDPISSEVLATRPQVPAPQLPTPQCSAAQAQEAPTSSAVVLRRRRRKRTLSEEAPRRVEEQVNHHSPSAPRSPLRLAQLAEPQEMVPSRLSLAPQAMAELRQALRRSGLALSQQVRLEENYDESAEKQLTCNKPLHQL